MKNKDYEAQLQQLTVKQYGSKPKRSGANGIIYTRVSSQEQAENNGSLEVQMKYCQEFAKRSQIPIRETFGGSYESAKSDGRKEFQRMLAFVRKNKDIIYIIVFNYDRFSRTGAAAAQLSEDLSKEGIIVKSVTQDIDTSTASGRLQENFFHMLNNFDNRAKSDRTKINTREVMLKGYWPYTTPLGYNNLNKKHRACLHEYVITDEGKELKKAFFLKAEGKLSNVEIIAIMNAKGVRLTQKNFRSILSNTFYAGYVTGKLVNGKLIIGKHPALIDLKTFLAANGMLQNATSANIPKQYRHEEVPLKIFVRDEVSGQPLSGYITKGNWYYKTKNVATPVNISAKKLNALFISNLSNFEYKEEYKPTIKKLMVKKIKARLSNAVDESKLLRKKITEKKGQLESLEEKFIMGEITKELYNKYSIRYNDEIQLLNSELEKSDINSSNFEKAIEKCLEIAQKISAAWLSAGFDNKQKLQKLVSPEGMVYNKQDGVVRTFKINSLFSEIAPLTRIAADMKKGNSFQNCLQSLPVTWIGFEPMTLSLEG